MDNVLFLINENELFAFFPDIEADNQGNKLSYAHIGQHSACSIEYANEATKATTDEYQSLYNELTKVIDYKLNVLN